MIEFNLIPKENIFEIIPLLKQLNDKSPTHLVRERLLEMTTQNYECVGMYLNGKLIGICGIWYMTRHYIGKSSEIDHVVIDKKLQSKGYGKQFILWVVAHLKSKGVEACELNAYIPNVKSHIFYEREDFKKYGFHFLRVLRDDGEFY
jgi:GNAT superfamily N-acetyltransferase